MATMDCSDARPLVPSYLDGELTEAQAGPLRKHLLACQPCRAGAQAQKNLKRWFAPSEPVAVPRDFSARVARLAFSGAAGVDEAAAGREDHGRRGSLAAPAAAWRVAAPRSTETPVLQFVLRLTVAAAVLALLASVAIQGLRRPSSAELRADDRPTMTLDQALERLDRLERADERRSGSAPSLPR
ncbi:MAG: zf-HC2 domain-containing protein [Planctomycetes bacterium]|nr:zf-HC2 domain-containing protein [Planctomycetota bacterium]